MCGRPAVPSTPAAPHLPAPLPGIPGWSPSSVKLLRAQEEPPTPSSLDGGAPPGLLGLRCHWVVALSPLGRGSFSFQGDPVPKEGSASHPHSSHGLTGNGGGLGASEGGQDRAHGPSWHCLGCLAHGSAVSWAAEVSCARWAGGCGGDRTQRGRGEGRAKCLVLPQWALFQFL